MARLGSDMVGIDSGSCCGVVSICSPILRRDVQFLFREKLLSFFIFLRIFGSFVSGGAFSWGVTSFHSFASFLLFGVVVRCCVLLPV